MKKICMKFLMVMLLVCSVSVAYAGVDATGCDDDTNEFITPELALCSVHAYNIGLSQNPGAGAERSLMQNVVALKTTVITQQLYNQYEVLKNTVKRFESQLKKEVLLANLNAAAGVNAGSSSGTSRETSSFNLEDCTAISDIEKSLECIQRNLNKIIDFAKSGKMGRTQFNKEMNSMYVVIDGRGVCDGEKNNKCSALSQCNNVQNKQDIQACANAIKFKIDAFIDKRKREDRGYDRRY